MRGGRSRKESGATPAITQVDDYFDALKIVLVSRYQHSRIQHTKSPASFYHDTNTLIPHESWRLSRRALWPRRQFAAISVSPAERSRAGA